jgi:hypothetical protein
VTSPGEKHKILSENKANSLGAWLKWESPCLARVRPLVQALVPILAVGQNPSSVPLQVKERGRRVRWLGHWAQGALVDP